MYLHYFLSVLGVKSWWRKYITQMQLAQFAIILTQVRLLPHNVRLRY